MMGTAAQVGRSRVILQQAKLMQGVGMRPVSAGSSRLLVMGNQRMRYFSSNQEKKEEEPAGEAKEESATEPEASQEPPKEKEKAQGGGSFMPILGGLALLGGGAAMMMMRSGGDDPKTQTEMKKEVAQEPKPEAKPEEVTPTQHAVDGKHDLVDVEILAAETLEEGTMMELKVGAGKQDKVLITRYQDKLHAVGAFCTHFGAPLVNGVLFDDKVLCPWHGCGFSVTSGALEYAPGVDGLPKYAIHEKDGKWFVRVPKKLEKKQGPAMARRDPSNKTKMVIIGGGAAGLNCAETLRQSNFTGEILVISNEKALPYDRTLLSKTLATMDASKLTIRESDFLDNYGIDYQLGYEAASIDKKAKKVILSDGAEISYDKLLLATGGRARVPPTPGIDLKNVHVLRSASDQAWIKEAAKEAKSIVVVGGGFISSECTANLQKTYKGKKQIHMLCDFKVPMERQFGYDVGAMILHEHEQNGAKVQINANVFKLKYEGDKDGKVEKVILEDGQEIPADLVIVGAGIIPNIELAKNAGLETNIGGVKTNPFLQTSDADIFAAGDIASFPCLYTGTNLRIEHWIAAQDQGTHAAFNMLGKMVPYGSIPFFWTNHYGKGMQYVGAAMEWDEIHVDGVPRDNKFIAYYIKDNKVLAACAQGRGKDLLTIFEAMNQNAVPPADQIKSGAATPETIASKLKRNKGGGACKRKGCCQKKSVVQ